MKCINCGNEIQPGSKFCRFCGCAQPASAPATAPNFTPVPPAYPPVSPNPAPGYPPVASNPAPNYAPVPPYTAPGHAPAAPAPEKKSGTALKIILPIVGGVLLLAIIGLVLFFVLRNGGFGFGFGNGGSEMEELNGMTPEELYLQTQEDMSEATSFSSESTQDITIMAYGQEITMNQTVISKQNGYDLYIKSENNMDANEMEITYVDGVYYENMNGQKTRTQISRETMERYYSDLYGTDGSYSTALLNIPEELLEDLTYVKDGDSYTVTVFLPAEQYTEMIGKMGISDAEFTEDVEYVIYFSEDGELEKVVATFEFEVMGYTASAVSTTLFQLGDVTIEPPADANQYVYY